MSLREEYQQETRKLLGEINNSIARKYIADVNGNFVPVNDDHRNKVITLNSDQYKITKEGNE